MAAEKRAEEEGGVSKMQIKLIENNSKTGKMSFMLKDSTPAFANTLRRAIIDMVPTMAIETVEFAQNSSVLYDEMIAHRLGLFVLSTDLKSYNIPSKCSCKGKGCAKCTLKLVLKAKGPGTVYASDMKSKDPKVKPVFPKTVVAKLLKDQEIELVATAILGKGNEHSKWSPGHVHYSYLPNVTVNNDSKNFEEFKNKYPPQAFDKSGKLSKTLIIENNLIDACDEVCEDVVKIDYDKTGFIFHVESWGQLDPVTMVNEAIDALNEDLDEFAKKLSKLK